jgi:hypothetical protein
LARQALGEPRGHCEFDFRHNHSDWVKGARKARYELYPLGAKVSKKQIAEINIHPDSFHGEWNYTIRPNI